MPHWKRYCLDVYAVAAVAVAAVLGVAALVLRLAWRGLMGLRVKHGKME